MFPVTGKRKRSVATYGLVIQTALISCALAGGNAGTDDQVLAVFEKATERLTRHYVELYEGALEFIGFRIRRVCPNFG